MLFYHWFERARRIQLEQAHEQGLEQGRQELLQRFDQVFAGDKDAMEKRDQIFNGITETKKIILLRSALAQLPPRVCFLTADHLASSERARGHRSHAFTAYL